jgi:DNA modification methylase
MKSIHPFPARMAPEIIDELLDDLPPGATVLDPMCGSGTVVRKAAHSGKKAIGLDSDPLAVLMTSVAVSSLNSKSVEQVLQKVLSYARKYGPKLRSVITCEETEIFSHFWFAPEQREQLNALVRGINRERSLGTSKKILDLLRLALSRTIITKNAGASLAADVSHSRPHRVRITNDYNVVANFEKFTRQILTEVNQHSPDYKPKVRKDDARILSAIETSSIDAIITSPPYLNALDYVRGHKLSLIWLGKTIPELKALRDDNVGSESRLSKKTKTTFSWDEVLQSFPSLSRLNNRQQLMTHRYIEDLAKLSRQFQRVLRGGAHLHMVIGNSTLGDVYVPNSELFAYCAMKFGFGLEVQREREIPANRRYMPISGETSQLSKRMRTEVIQTFLLTKP